MAGWIISGAARGQGRAEARRFLVSDVASMITGAEYLIDGGTSA